MSAITDFAPVMMKDAILTFGANDYSAVVSEAILDPTASTVTFKGINSAKKVILTDVEWALRVTFPQDHAAADGLSRYLYDRQGESLPVVITPSAGGAAYATTILVVPGAIGGKVGSLAESTVAFPATDPDIQSPAVP